MTDTPEAPTQPAPTQQGNDTSLFKILLLVSAIFNSLAALSAIVAGLLTIIFIVGCFILPFGAALAVLAFFEFKAFMALNDDSAPNPPRDKVKLLAILEICTIIMGNMPSVVCGIVSLVQINNYPDDAPVA